MSITNLPHHNEDTCPSNSGSAADRWVVRGKLYNDIVDKFEEVIEAVGELETQDPLIYKGLISQTSTMEVLSTDGPLIPGTKYCIKTIAQGDDFSNFGIENENDQVFIPGTLSGESVEIQENVNAVAQVEYVKLTGASTANYIAISGPGGLTCRLSGIEMTLAQIATLFAENYADAYLAEGIIVTADNASIFFTAAVAGVPFTPPTVTVVPWDLDGTVAHTQAYSAPDQQSETVTLTGTSGTAAISGAGLEMRLATFRVGLTETAADFVTAYAADYLAEGVIVTSILADIIFTAEDAGVAFDHVDVLNGSGDLDGTVSVTQENVEEVVKIDTITLTGTLGGVASVEAAGIGPHALFLFPDLNTPEFESVPKTLAEAAELFATQNLSAYSNVDITLSFSGSDIILTGQAGTGDFTSPVITMYPAGDLDGTIGTENTPNVEAVAQVQELIVTGDSGQSMMYADGNSPVQLLEFNTDIPTTLANFVTTYAEYFLSEHVIITRTDTSLIFTSETPGNAFDTYSLMGNVTPAVWENGTVLMINFDPYADTKVNTLGDFTLRRLETGVYEMVFEESLFTENNMPFITPQTSFVVVEGSLLGLVFVSVDSENTLLIQTTANMTPADSMMNNVPLTIEVYPQPL